MNTVWLQPCPHPDQPNEVPLLNAASTLALRAQPTHWTETRRSQPHRWALQALLSGQRTPVEVIRGEHENLGRTVSTDLARILTTEKTDFDRQGLGGIARCEKETPHGVLFDMERTHRPQDSKDWWPCEYQVQVRRAKSKNSPTRQFNPARADLTPDDCLLVDQHAEAL